MVEQNKSSEGVPKSLRQAIKSAVVLDLTICSVYHSEESKRLLELNRELALKLNQYKNFTWIACDNTHGVNSSFLPAYIPSGRGILGSYEHAAAINQTLKLIKSRFALILDNDFFIVRPNWIQDVLGHMQAKNLAFFGAPWHPRWWRKFRYFPAHHALFVDGDKIKLSDLNFLPQYTPESFAKRMDRKGRACIGMSRDTGYALYEKYYRKNIAFYECLKPVFKPYAKAAPMERWAKKACKFLLPDRFLYIPKNSDYFSDIGFNDFGYYNASGNGWEEFMWQERPFGFHMRGAKNKTAVPEIEEILSRF